MMTNDPTPAEIYVETRAARWDSQRAACETFYEDNGTWPHTSSNDPTERRLGEWLGRIRTQARRGTLSEEQRTALDEMSRRVGYDWTLPRRLPVEQPPPPTGPEDTASNRPNRWTQRLTTVETFYRAHQRWPRGGAADPTESELGWWMSRQRERISTLTEDQRAALDAMSRRVGHDWRTRPRDKGRKRPPRPYAISAEGRASRQFAWDQHWETKRATLESFYVRMGRWPRRTATDEVERMLAGWRTVQRTQYRRGDLTSERLDALTQMSRRLRADWMATRRARPRESDRSASTTAQTPPKEAPQGTVGTSGATRPGARPGQVSAVRSEA